MANQVPGLYGSHPIDPRCAELTRVLDHICAIGNKVDSRDVWLKRFDPRTFSPSSCITYNVNGIKEYISLQAVPTISSEDDYNKKMGDFRKTFERWQKDKEELQSLANELESVSNGFEKDFRDHIHAIQDKIAYLTGICNHHIEVNNKKAYLTNQAALIGVMFRSNVKCGKVSEAEIRMCEKEGLLKAANKADDPSYDDLYSFDNSVSAKPPSPSLSITSVEIGPEDHPLVSATHAVFRDAIQSSATAEVRSVGRSADQPWGNSPIQPIDPRKYTDRSKYY
jgi:hypothetical protein